MKRDDLVAALQAERAGDHTIIIRYGDTVLADGQLAVFRDGPHIIIHIDRTPEHDTQLAAALT